MMQRWLGRIILVSCFWMLGSAMAAVPQHVQYELFSWPKGDAWHFSVIEGTQTIRSLETIQSRKNTLRSVTYLKGRLATLQPGDTLYWRERQSQGLKLPPTEIIQDVQRYMEGEQLNLVLPQDLSDPSKPASKPSTTP